MTYDTDDIAVAAALRHFGHPILHIDIIGKRAKFKFPSESEAEAVKIQLGEKLVDALRFHNEVRRLTVLVRSMVIRES
jgi:hypothetical protein